MPWSLFTRPACHHNQTSQVHPRPGLGSCWVRIRSGQIRSVGCRNSCHAWNSKARCLMEESQHPYHSPHAAPPQKVEMWSDCKSCSRLLDEKDLSRMQYKCCRMSCGRTHSAFAKVHIWLQLRVEAVGLIARHVHPDACKWQAHLNA